MQKCFVFTRWSNECLPIQTDADTDVDFVIYAFANVNIVNEMLFRYFE